MDKDYKIVLVIGNGFDLDIGLKTRYSDFMKSRPFERYVTGVDELSRFKNYEDSDEKKDINLFNYLKGLFQLNNWIDIETAFANLASDSRKGVKRSDGTRPVYKRRASRKEETTFQELHTALFQYLKSIEYNKLNKDSVALKLLRIINKYRLSEVLSFNYTDLKMLEGEVGPINMPIDYIHGQVSDNSIILGIQDELDIDNSYCFMIKSFSTHFKSHSVRRKLLDANEIIFFGHSLGSTDYHYFEDLFKRQSRANGEEKADEKLILRIFTYDERSRREVLTQLRRMNEKRTDMLFDLCDFQIYRTKNECGDIDKIKDYLEELDQRIEEHTPTFAPGPKVYSF